jgi:hypothetical protein
MALKEELSIWLEENISCHDKDTLDNLWNFLEERIGPVQEKLINDIDMLRSEKRQLERKLEAFVDEFKRIQQGTDSENS